MTLAMTTSEIYELMRKDKAVRRAIVRRSHKYFFHYYFGHYVQFPSAAFHDDFFQLSQNDHYSLLVISAFRNSGKSTIWSLSYVIWSIISNRVKFAVVMSKNQQKARTLFGHIKAELESNTLLRGDLGPFKEEPSTWNAASLQLERYGAKISAYSVEQSIRGIRHLNYRPGLIVLDDIEDQESVKTQEGRDKIDQWLSGDIIPAGDRNTRVVVIGSILHLDSIIPRLQKRIDANKINGAYRSYPIVDDAGRPTWPEKFPTAESIEKEKMRGITDREWTIEYLLQPVIDEDQVIREEWIQYYDKEPTNTHPRYWFTATGVDLAISENTKADFTAMVSGVVTKEDDDWKLNILPYPVNEHMDSSKTTEKAVHLSLALGNGQSTEMYIEDVGFQKAIIEMIRQRGIVVEGVSPGGTDKRARLASIAMSIKRGQVLFPRRGAEQLIRQLVGFGVEKHDDLVDALVYLVLKVMQRYGSNNLVFPEIQSEKSTRPPTREELEREADHDLIYKQEIANGINPQIALARYHIRKQKKDRKESWKKYERDYWNQYGGGP